MKPLAALMRRELSLAWAGGGGPGLALAFYAALTMLAPLAGGPGVAHGAGAAAAIAWIGLLLANLLTVERLFAADYEDGGLDLLAGGPLPLEAVALVKCLAHALAVGCPLAVAAPAAAVGLGLPVAAAGVLLAAAAIGGVAFACVGGFGASLTLMGRRGGLITAVIVLPLLSPPVVFGGGALAAALAGRSTLPALALLGGYALGALAIASPAIAAACRVALE